jgi:hypothetical protein
VFNRFNDDKPYAGQIKPFNFMLTAAGAKPPARVPPSQKFRLVTPYDLDARQWEEAEYVNIHHPEAGEFFITTRDGRPGLARVDTFADVLASYQTHPESKSIGDDGRVCNRSTIGLLRRRLVIAGAITMIGKEAHRIEQRVSGELTIDDLDSRVTTYQDHDEWYRVVVPKLRKLGVAAVAEATGVSERRARDWLKGRSMPHRKHQEALSDVV